MVADGRNVRPFTVDSSTIVHPSIVRDCIENQGEVGAGQDVDSCVVGRSDGEGEGSRGVI